MFLAPHCPSTTIHHILRNSHNCCDHRRLRCHHRCRKNIYATSTKIASRSGIYLTTTAIYLSKKIKKIVTSILLQKIAATISVINAVFDRIPLCCRVSHQKFTAIFYCHIFFNSLH
ncbi:hypothetical protein BHE74_00017190 [Ensete ventricosum]|nr:hypothetical protein BHE74_00017190 [Ensete ventricosum]